MTSYEPGWRAIGEQIAQKCESDREAIEQMADLFSVVRFAQLAADKQKDASAQQLLDLIEMWRNIRDKKEGITRAEVSPAQADYREI